MKWWDRMTWSSFSECWVLMPSFSLSSFTFIKRLFGSSLSAISVVSSAYLRLLMIMGAHSWQPHHICGEGSGTPLQYSCLENPMDGGAWWTAVHGVVKSRTRLSDFTFTFLFYALEKEMATQSVFLPGESQGRGSLVGCRLWGRTESDTTEVT